ncbi:unnamed protein product [Amoebophrya sp. A25]|nr:unnamed protein product [Amoebophrya sp. A25]CAD7969021.1 unnamed protein product [Amoebophrya sp. A25]|eukprot:GSA25T00022109001.1
MLVDDRGWLYLGPILAIQLCFFAAAFRARTIRFQQLVLCGSGFYWSLLVYYVQYFPAGTKTLFCDVTASSCSYCLHHRISFLPEFFGLASGRGNPMNRSIGDTSIAYYTAHLLYPLLQKLPFVGFYVTHLGCLLSCATGIGSFALLFRTYQDVKDPCLINFIMYIINWGLARAMCLHFYTLYYDKRLVKKRE